MQPNTFQNKAHADEYGAWIMERIRTGELTETLHRRHMTIQLNPATIELYRRIQQTKGATNEPQTQTPRTEKT
jgi:negative regulator of sigma E activity